MDQINPLAICLVSSGSRGDRLLFRYPYETEDEKETLYQNPKKTPYAQRIIEDYSAGISHVAASDVSDASHSMLVGYSDQMLGNLLAARPGLCGRKFEVKVSDVVFVGYPMMLQHLSATQPSPKRETIMPTISSFNLVFALRANECDEGMLRCYQDLAKQLAVALRHEEKRCRYLHGEKDMMLHCMDEVATMPEDSLESPFQLMLKKVPLAKQLKQIYDNLCNTGVVQTHINKWIQVSFCLPHKVHSLQLPSEQRHLRVQADAVMRCIANIRPFHGMLLVEDEESMIAALPIDSSPSLIRLIRVTSPLKSLQNLASDADLSLGQVFQLVSHLVYWGKATIIYPLCESNIYVLARNTNLHVNSSLVQEFVDQFPRKSLTSELADFSLPTALGEHRDVLGLPHQQAQEVQIVVWMLRHRLLIQLHTFIFLVPSSEGSKSRSSSYTSSLLYDSTGSSRARSQTVYLSPVAEDTTQPASKSVSISDNLSVTSEGSPSQNTFGTFSTRTPSVEVANDGTVITEETRAQWRLQDTLLAKLSAHDKQSIMSIPAANNPEDLKLFARLCPYFNGKHHIEEIMYYENVRRSQLLTLLDKFRDVLVMCQHEDQGIMGFDVHR